MESNCIVNIVDHPTIHVVPSLPLARIRMLAPASIKPSVISGGAKHRDSVVSIVESSIMLEMMDGERYARSHDMGSHDVEQHNVRMNFLSLKVYR